MKTEKEIDAELDRIDYFDFLKRQGFMNKPKSTVWQKIKKTAFYPFKLIQRFFSKIAWELWGKRIYSGRVRLQADRMKFLATYKSESEPYYTSAPPKEIIPYPAALALHDEIIKTKIVKEELPKPDFDDGTN